MDRKVLLTRQGIDYVVIFVALCVGKTTYRTPVPGIQLTNIAIVFSIPVSGNPGSPGLWSFIHA